MKPYLGIIFLLGLYLASYSQRGLDPVLTEKIDAEVRHSMEEGGIPGLSLVIIDSGRQIVRTFGYADLENKKPVTPHTLFQLGSCSKAFTALAIMKLAAEKKIDLNGYVSDYLPWFRMFYRDSAVRITILQLLHHTAGISWQTIAAIPESNDPDALEQTVRRVISVGLRRLPGKRYEYATVDYDILALIIQEVTHLSFEEYCREEVLDKLRLDRTTIGEPRDAGDMALGYKMNFLGPSVYAAPVYRGNNAAGYVISDILDLEKWLRFQMGLDMRDSVDSISRELYAFAKLTHQRDETVPLHGMNSYAMGWDISLSGNGEISHDGLNPNYSAYIAFRTTRPTGIAILTNGSSDMTSLLGKRIMRLLANEKVRKEIDPGGGRIYTAGILIAGIYIAAILAYLGLLTADIVRGRRKYRSITLVTLWKFVLTLCCALPFLAGLYLLPEAMAGFSWKAMLVWSPFSLGYLMMLILGAIALTYAAYLVSLCFPGRQDLREKAPKLLLISILAGVANMAVILLVTSAVDSPVRLRYLVFYYLLTLSFFLLGRRFVQISLIRLSRGLIYDMKLKLIEKIFSASYRQFETIDRGRIYTALNDDVETLGGSADQAILLLTNTFTIIGCFLYLTTIAFWTAVMTIFLIVVIATIYYIVSRRTWKYFESARDARNVYMRLINGMIDGFKEISLRMNKKLEYKADIGQTARDYRDRISTAGIRFVNAFIVGDSLLVLLLGTAVFAIPRMFPDIRSSTIMSFVIVLLYLIGPVNGILTAGPAIMQLRVAWNRLRQFLEGLPAAVSLEKPACPVKKELRSFRAEGIRFKYKADQDGRAFALGPIDLEVSCGEILFIVGGNGSGKSTLAKLLTGLYPPDEGKLLIDGKVVENGQLSEYYSTVFCPPYIFEKLYDIDTKNRTGEINKYLKLLNLEHKVGITGSRYSTIDLSNGQRKRLALLQCYMEDAPIYLFDEWAADQDPAYRNFFYRSLLPDMKRMGKIVIAITHDDHYFDVADRIYQMNMGRIEEISRESLPEVHFKF
jgi:putative ATP-binding cassette transporter